MRADIRQWTECSDTVEATQPEATMTKLILVRYVVSVAVNKELDLDEAALQDEDLLAAVVETAEAVIEDDRIATGLTETVGQRRTILLPTWPPTNRKKNRFVHFTWRENVLGETIAPTHTLPFHRAKWNSANSI